MHTSGNARRPAQGARAAPRCWAGLLRHLSSALANLRPRLRDSDGSVLVLAAMSLVVVMGAGAITVDLGRAWVQKTQLQSAADAAALAGARDLDAGPAAAIATAEALLVANGVAPATATITVETTFATDDTLRVQTNATTDWLFAPVLGADAQQAVGAQAVALRQNVVAGGYALFADPQGCTDGIQMSGGNISITGGTHSNGDITVSGSNNAVIGSTVYVGSLTNSGSGNSFTPPAVGGSNTVYPVTFDILDYQPGGAKAVAAAPYYYDAGASDINTGWLISQGLLNPPTSVLTDGLYLTTGDINLSGSNLTGNVTFVTFVTSNGEIKFSGSNHNLQPWDAEGLLAFSNETGSCSNAVVNLSGSGSGWTGIVYAPNGLIEMSGSGNANVDGALIGMSVKITGSGASITKTGGYSFGSPSALLIA